MPVFFLFLWLFSDLVNFSLLDRSIDVQQLIHPHGGNIVYALGFSGSSHFGTFELNAKNGELLKQDKFAFPGGFCGDISFLKSDTAVALDSTRSVLVSIQFRDGEISFQQAHISDLVLDSSGVAAILPSKLTEIVAVKVKKSIIFIKLTNEGKFVVVEKIDHTAVVSDSLSFSEGQQAVALIQQGDGKIQLTVKVISDWNSNLIKETIEMDCQRGLAQKIFLNSYIRTDRSSGFRALIVMEDHSLLLLQQGEIVWSREDGLASITEVTTSELPVEKDGVSVAKVEHSLFEWLKVWCIRSNFEAIINAFFLRFQYVKTFAITNIYLMVGSQEKKIK